MGTMDNVLNHESSIRFAVCVLALLLMSCLESLFPRRQRSVPRIRRWSVNLALVVVDSLVVRILVPLLAMSAATLAEKNTWGLFNQTSLPLWFEVVLAVVILDMLIYWQHVASHHFELLWKFHKVHHADRDIDASTGVRFHPFEIVLSGFYKVAIVIILGPAAVAVMLFEVLLNASAVFNHANLKLPQSIDRIIRALLVTPDMHRVHHSVEQVETNSNYGFNLSCWDRLFGTYIKAPADGHRCMTTGLADYQDSRPVSLRWVLLSPFSSRLSESEKRNS